MKTTNFNPNLPFNIAQGIASGGSAGGASGVEVKETDGAPDVADVSVIQVRKSALTDNGSGNVTIATVNPAYGGLETLQSHGNLGSTETIDLASGNSHAGTLNANCTFTFTGATTAFECSFLLELTEDGTGGWTVTWPGSVVWPGGSAPTHTTTAGSVTIYVFRTRDGGTTWYGFQAGAGIASSSFATPAIVLGTAAAAGAATTVIRSDSTLAAFDATVPVTQAFGDAAATGSVAFAARRDHVHGMPTQTGVGEIIISDSPSTPLVFADLVQNEAQNDLVYGDI